MYDVIVVGGRCAGAATGMLLARRGCHVLIVDRTSFPADTLCTNQLGAEATARLRRWGVLDRLVPPGSSIAHLAPRRAVLDTVLTEAARSAGAEVWQDFAVRDVVWDGDRVTGIVGQGADGRTTCHLARVVIGADGRQSLVARSVGAGTYGEQPSTACCYLAYWRDTGITRPAWWTAPGASVGAVPTDDGLTCVVVRLRVGEWSRFKRGPEETYLAQVDRFPGLADSIREAVRVSRFAGTADLGRAARCAAGPGWALVGDAGRHADPITWPGIANAFAQADVLAGTLVESLTGRASVDGALATFRRIRDAIDVKSIPPGWRGPRRGTGCAVRTGRSPLGSCS